MKFMFVLLISMNMAHATLIGKAAPSFNLMNEVSQKISLSQFKGKVVILEWLNHGCPFIKKHYNSGNMQSVQKKVIDKDTVWLSIISSAEGKQGYRSPKEALADKENYKSLSAHILLDTDGKVGQLYEAKTTPHMFIINKAGKVVYEGAIDSIATADPSDISKAENYVLTAMKSLKSGKSIATKKTRPYGCSVKY